MKVAFGLSVLGIAGIFAGSAFADTMTLSSNDGRVQTSTGSPVVDDQGDYVCNIGEYFSPGGSCYIMPFLLPTLPAGYQFSTADLRSQLYYMNTQTTPAPADLYGVGVRASSMPLASDYYQGAAPDPSATLIQANYLTSSTPLRIDGDNGFVDTTAGADATLASFLNSAYANGANAGKYVFLRVSYDQDPIGFGNDSYGLLTQDAGGANEKPRLSYTAVAAITGGVTAWTQISAGDWNSNSNWSAGVPGLAGAEADFFSTVAGPPRSVFSDTDITVGTINFNSVNNYVIGGAGSLTLQTNTGNAQIIVQTGTQKINLPLTIASNTVFNVSSGATLKISDPMTINSGLSLSTTGNGTVTYESTITLLGTATMSIANATYAHALTMQGTSAATIAASTGSPTIFQLDSLSIASGSKLDVNNNELVVHGGVLSAITSQVAAGFSGGTWSGNGITSSAAQSDGTFLHALGVAQVNSNEVEVKYTYYGDADLSGSVSGNDYTLIDVGFNSQTGGSPLSGWSNGDFNYDNKIDGSDYTLIDNAFNLQGAAIPASEVATSTAEIAGGATAVPEPASLSLLAIAAASLITRRRRSPRASAM